MSAHVANRRRPSRVAALAVVLALSLASALLGAAPPPAGAAPAGDVTVAQPTGDFEQVDCPEPLPGLDPVEGLTCGLVTVPLDHDDPDGDTVQVAVAVSPATDQAVDDPVLVLGGGPGESLLIATPLLVGPGSQLEAANADRDVVVLDQRGVGYSQPNLDCPETMAIEVGEPTVAPEELAGLFAQAMEDCRQRLADSGIDGDTLSAFNTRNNAADLDAVRAALGHESMHLYGTSYGARLALRAAGAFPDSWTSQVLASPVPGEANWFEDVAPTFDAALAGLFAACEDDEDCSFAHRESAETLRRVIERLRDEPGTVEITDPQSGQEVTVPVTAYDLAATLFMLFYLTPALGAVPALIDAFDAGRYDVVFEVEPDAPVVQEVSPTRRDGLLPGQADVFDRLGRPDARPDRRLLLQQQDVPMPMAQGMQASFLCAEEVAYADRAGLEASVAAAGPAAGEFLTHSPLLGLNGFDLCDDVWPVDQADPSTFEPVVSDLPSLVVTGELDQITSPEYGSQVLDGLSEGFLVEVPEMGHSPLLPLEGCGAQVLADFLDDPGAQPDRSCVDEHALTFVTAPVAAARGVDNACPPGDVADVPFVDVAPGDTHATAIACIAWWELTVGVDGERYGSLAPVTRGQMATFIARHIERTGGQLPAAPGEAFPDVAGDVHEPAINQLAELEIVSGFGDGSFRPRQAVNRGQMATFLVHGLEYRRGQELRPGPRVFHDTGPVFDTHGESIDKASAAKLVTGRADGSYDAPSAISRAQMASFLGRGLDLLVFEGVTGIPTAR